MSRQLPKLVALCSLILPSLCASQTPDSFIAQVLPARPIVELRGKNQLLNFDLQVRNTSALTIRIAEIEINIFDSAHHLVLRKSINKDAFAPSIAIIGTQILAPQESLDIFNPFYAFASEIPLAYLQYSFCVQNESNDEQRKLNLHRLPGDCDRRQQVAVNPRAYQDKTYLSLPLHGKIFIWEGHDFYAHHFRVPLADPRIQALGITANSNQFADDFIYLDSQGRSYSGDPRKLENWFSYGKPIYAPGSGVVVSSADDIPDNQFEDSAAAKISQPKLSLGRDPKDLGNFVLIDHENGEYSLLLHMKPGSVTAKTGDHVKIGQQIGQVGFSGDSLFPHLHYALMDGPEVFKAWGIPAYFTHFQRVLGQHVVEEDESTVDSGDFAETEAK